MIISNNNHTHLEGSMWSNLVDFVCIIKCLSEDIPKDVIQSIVTYALESNSDTIVDEELLNCIVLCDGFTEMMNALPQIDAQSKAILAARAIMETLSEKEDS